MDTKETKHGPGDFNVRHPEGGGVVVASPSMHIAMRSDDIAAFTTPAEMVEWLAEQYGLPEPLPAEVGAAPAEAPQQPPALYQWKTREDFVAALTMAISVHSAPPYPWVTSAPAERARQMADIIDSVHAQGIGG